MENKTESNDKDVIKDLCVDQGYVPKTCLLPGPIILYATGGKSGDACKECYHDRNVCFGRPRTEDVKTERLLFLECACCGQGFRGWQHWGRDGGYGICDSVDCAKAYGYHTVGPRPDKVGYEALKEKISKL